MSNEYNEIDEENGDGYIYCMSNPSMPGILKCGKTKRTPQQRLFEANIADTWRPPTPYNIEFAKKVYNVDHEEKLMHRMMKDTRIHHLHEFFKNSVEEVRKIFDEFEGEMWSQPPIINREDKKIKENEEKNMIIAEILSLLGMANPRDVKKWSSEEWEKLVPLFHEPKTWPDLPADSSLKSSSLHQRLKVSFGLRNRYGPEGTGYSPSIRLQLNLNTILSTLYRTELRTRSVKTGTMRKNADGSVFKGNLVEMEAEFKKFLRVQLSADLTFSPVKGSPKTKWAPAKWEEGSSPSDRVSAIERRVGAAWQEEKARLGISDLIDIKPQEFFTIPSLNKQAEGCN
jgi:hypothetical protein